MEYSKGISVSACSTILPAYTFIGLGYPGHAFISLDKPGDTFIDLGGHLDAHLLLTHHSILQMAYRPCSLHLSPGSSHQDASWTFMLFLYKESKAGYALHANL